MELRNSLSRLLPLTILIALVVVGLGIEATFYDGPRIWTKLPVLGLVAWAFFRSLPSFRTKRETRGEG